MRHVSLTRRSRATPLANYRIAPIERWVWAAVVIGQLSLAPLFVDLFPFSSMPMFSAAPSRLLGLQILDEDGRPLPLNRFGIEPVYLANPRPRIGMRNAGSLILDAFELRALEPLVRSRLGRAGLPSAVQLRRNILELNGGDALQVVAHDELTVTQGTVP